MFGHLIISFFAKVLNVSSRKNVVRLAVDVQKETYHLMDLDSFPVIELVGVQRLNLQAYILLYV